MNYLSFCLALSGLAAFAMGATPAHAQDSRSLVERLGFAPDAKVLIINADDFGMNQAGTEATMDGLKSGVMTSATIMVPCSWFPAVVKFAKAHPQANLGVHTTLTSEWGSYRWGPVIGQTAAPSLVDDLGYFYPDVRQVYAHAKLDEVDKEVRAQIDRAIKAGIDVTHIDSHMGTLQYDAKYHQLYLKIAKDYNLPCRLAGRDLMKANGAEAILDMARDMGVLGPEHLFMGGANKPEETESYWTGILKQVRPGLVSEIYIHPGQPTPEMKATTSSWAKRTAEAEFFSKPSTMQLIKDLGIELISYRELRELQRTGKPLPRTTSYGW